MPCLDIFRAGTCPTERRSYFQSCRGYSAADLAHWYPSSRTNSFGNTHPGCTFKVSTYFSSFSLYKRYGVGAFSKITFNIVCWHFLRWSFESQWPILLQQWAKTKNYDHIPIPRRSRRFFKAKCACPRGFVSIAIPNLWAYFARFTLQHLLGIS